MAAASAPREARGRGRPRVGIVGGGIGGVAAAWLLDGDYDVVLFEAEPQLGGHAHTIAVDYRGRQVAVDVGAQNFSPATHPTYVKLLQLLGFFEPTDPAHSPTLIAPATVTVYTSATPTPLFVSPFFPDRTWPLAETWNTPAVGAFAALVGAGKQMERDDLDWNVTLEQWVEPLTISRQLKDGLVYPFVASLNNQHVEATKALSARAALYFVSRALPDNPFAGVTYYNSLLGLGGIVHRLADDCTTLAVHAGAPVRHVARVGSGFRIATKDRHELVDHLIVATPPYVARRLVHGLPNGERLGRVLAAFPYYHTTITVHTDPAYVAANRMYWSFENVEVSRGWAEGSLWYGSVHPPFDDGSTVDIFKSWTTHRDRAPQSVLYTEDFRHALPTPDFGRAQQKLAPFQGRHGVWFVGSHCIEVDSQDTALRSAMHVADVLAPASTHYLALKAMLASAAMP